VWAAGASVLAFRWIMGWRAADSLARAARPAPGSSLDTRVTDAAIEPAVARVFHPVVLLPSALLGRLSAAELDAVLAHERAHIRRHDNFTARLHGLVEILFWFHPLVWWIGRQMLEEREQACDEAVLAQGHDATKYAEGILAVCRHCHDLSRAPAASSALSGDLTRRIRTIIRHVPPVSPGFCKTVALSAGTLAFVVTLMFAGANDRAQELRTQIERDAHALDSAVIYVSVATPGAGKAVRLEASGSSVRIHNITLRELVAMSYDVDIVRMAINDRWLDAARYDIDVRANSAMTDAKRFDPLALQGVVNKLIASRFDLEIHVNQRCQDPCGRRAQAASAQTL
jgi:bla regulator protein BlaR1